jgi:hypothetical protein
MAIKTAMEGQATSPAGCWQHIGESQGCEDHDHDLIHELSRRLDALWRYDQFIANAGNRPAVQNCWRELKAQEFAAVERLKALMRDEIQHGCF